MNSNKIIYWVTTCLVAVMMVFSAYQYLTADTMKAAFVHLGFPSYFRVELAIAKLIGAAVLLLPGVSNTLKQVAYAGFALTFISAFIAHTSSGDPMSVAIVPLVFLAILAVSYFYYVKTASNKNSFTLKPQSI